MENFSELKVPSWFYKFLSSKGPFFLGYGGYCHPKVLPWVSQVFATPGSPIGFGRNCNPMVPLWALKVFRHQGSLLRFFWFLSPWVTPWVWKIFLQVSPLVFTGFYHQRILLGFGRFFVTKYSPFSFQDFFATQRSLIGFARFCHPMVSPWVSRVFITKGTPLS